MLFRLTTICLVSHFLFQFCQVTLIARNVTLTSKVSNFHYFLSWCEGADSSFYVGDFNDDLRADWLCHYPDGRVCVRYNSLIFGCKWSKEEQLLSSQCFASETKKIGIIWIMFSHPTLSHVFLSFSANHMFHKMHCTDLNFCIDGGIIKIEFTFHSYMFPKQQKEIKDFVWNSRHYYWWLQWWQHGRHLLLWKWNHLSVHICSEM